MTEFCATLVWNVRLEGNSVVCTKAQDAACTVLVRAVRDTWSCISTQADLILELRRKCGFSPAVQTFKDGEAGSVRFGGEVVLLVEGVGVLRWTTERKHAQGGSDLLPMFVLQGQSISGTKK